MEWEGRASTKIEGKEEEKKASGVKGKEKKKDPVFPDTLSFEISDSNPSPFFVFFPLPPARLSPMALRAVAVARPVGVSLPQRRTVRAAAARPDFEVRPFFFHSSSSKFSPPAKSRIGSHRKKNKEN